MTENLKAPFPYFGGKSRIAPEIWQRFGNVPNYIEPFVGSAAALLGRPNSHRWWQRIETVNDKDGMISNLWRSIQKEAELVAQWADWPVNENDLHARHAWLVGQRESLQTQLEGDPDYCDPKVAGWWLWGICSWIGSGWCSGEGPWQAVDGQLVDVGEGGGINRQLPDLSWSRGIQRQLPHLSGSQGINRQLPHLSGSQGYQESLANITDMLLRLQHRFRRVRVASGDWSRVCGFTATAQLGLTGVFLDPPYSAEAERDNELYAVDNLTVAHEVQEWALERGDNPLYRIALCGYESEYEMPNGWRRWAWKAHGGYGLQGHGQARMNSKRERVWFSPHCLPPLQERLL